VTEPPAASPLDASAMVAPLFTRLARFLGLPPPAPPRPMSTAEAAADKEMHDRAIGR